jgi:hypothetical protein
MVQWVHCWSNIFYRSVCLSAIEFRSSEFYINPSRISPLDVCVKQIGIGTRPKYHLYTRQHRPAVCVSTIFCDSSHVLAPPDRGLTQKSISGIFHSQEWEHFVGFMCTVFDHERMSAQLAKDVLQFTTKAHFAKGAYSIDRILAVGF